ncbi:MAG: hypothetical protein KGN39_01715 [Betaproteobacteria bacterium]|nr:hypothetical protein [Betaproteobacteria bacterium]
MAYLVECQTTDPTLAGCETLEYVTAENKDKARLAARGFHACGCWASVYAEDGESLACVDPDEKFPVFLF